MFRVVRGEPDDAEVAALAAVLAAAVSSAADSAPGEGGPRSVWNERTSLVRRPLHPGPGAWRASTLPR
ncbi:MAG TPA: acyl-CoA carboxylase epsilon subunit [Pseudonocardia sp.]